MVKYDELNQEQIASMAANFCRSLREVGGASGDEAAAFERQMLALSGGDFAGLTYMYTYMADRSDRQMAFVGILTAWEQAGKSLSDMLAAMKERYGLEES